jgi:hypothetical protein
VAEAATATVRTLLPPEYTPIACPVRGDPPSSP